MRRLPAREVPMIKKLFRQMLVSQIVSVMTVTLCLLIDSIMIGRFLGVDAMSAYGLSTPLLLMFAAFGAFISTGVQVMCGKTTGAGDRDATDACFTASVLLVTGVSLAGLILIFSLLSPITVMLGAGRPAPGNTVFGPTREYVKGFIIGAPAFLAAQVMVPYMQLSGNRSRLVAAVAAMIVSDVALDLLNVFVFRGGMFGMGLASSLSYYIALAIGVLYFFRKDCMFRFRPRTVRGRTFLDLLRYGMPVVVNQVCVVLQAYLLNQILLDVSGNLGVAAYSVISTMGNVCYCFGTGVAAVALMLSSIFYAEEDRSSLRELVRVMTRYDVILALCVTAAVLLGGGVISGLFLSSDAAAKALTARGLRLFSLCLLPSALNSTLKNYYQGTNRSGLTQLISLLQNLAMSVLAAFLLSRFIGVTGVWLGFLCGETATLLILSAIVWKRRGRAELSYDAYAMLEPDFGAPADSCLERTIRTLDDAMDVSQQAMDFCLAHGLDARLSNLISLCIEEMTVNIVTHGFVKDTRPHQVDLRLVMQKDSRIIRIRDNCINFDPTRYLELHKSDDPTAHVGIRMVLAMVKNIYYVNTLGLNNLTLTL